MDFNDAISRHVQWKSRLAAYIARPDHSIDSAKLGREDQCELGRWLIGEGRRYAKNPEFAKLVDEHRRFHTAAADVVRRADSGQRVTEEVALGAHSEYAKASSDVIGSLMKLRQAA
jgi:methyl-accepting chemotaxis protein